MAYLFIDPVKQYVDSIALAWQVLSSGYRPDGIIGLLRGGAVPGMVVHEMHSMNGTRMPFDFITTEAYNDKRTLNNEIKIRGLAEINVKGKTLLVTDDLWDTGRTLNEVVAELLHLGATGVKTAVVYFKPEKNLYPMAPDYYVEKVKGGTWIVLPHELKDIPAEDLPLHPLYEHFKKGL